MSHPTGLPDLFLDRSLGRIQVPNRLRNAGLRLTTLAERYGTPADENITDETWLRDAGNRGEVVFMKDERVRYNQAEKLAVIQTGVKAFCLARGDLNAEAMAALFLTNLTGIARQCSSPGPCLYVISYAGMRNVPLG